jgi:hypothetical protein
MIVSFVCAKERHERTLHEQSLPTNVATRTVVGDQFVGIRLELCCVQLEAERAHAIARRSHVWTSILVALADDLKC